VTNMFEFIRKFAFCEAIPARTIISFVERIVLSVQTTFSASSSPRYADQTARLARPTGMYPISTEMPRTH
jgi:hypothetical protein